MDPGCGPGNLVVGVLCGLGYGVRRGLYPISARGLLAGDRAPAGADERRRSLIELLEMDRGECLRLVAATSGRVGRIAVEEPASPPIVRPVNFVFDERSQSVVFRSALGSKLTRVLDSAAAVFEIDGGDPVERTGWSVIIVGEPVEVTDSAEIDRLEDLELEPWAPGAKSHWVRIPRDIGVRPSHRPHIRCHAWRAQYPALVRWSDRRICKPRTGPLREGARCRCRGVRLCGLGCGCGRAE